MEPPGDQPQRPSARTASTLSRPRRSDASVTRRRRPASMSSRDDRAVGAHPLGDGGGLASGCGGDVGDPLPRARGEGPRRAPGSPGPVGRAPPATAGSTAGSPMPRTTTRRRRARRAPRSRRDRNSASSASAVTREGSGGGSWPPVRSSRRARRRASASPRSGREPLDEPVRIRQRDRVARRFGPWRPEPRERSQHRVAEPARPRRPRQRVDGLRHRRVRAARRAAVDTRRDGARHAPGDPAGGAGASRHPSRGHRGDAVPCTVPYTRSVAKARSRGFARSSRAASTGGAPARTRRLRCARARRARAPRRRHEPNRTGRP